nr:ATP synthase F0 subunit 8 [Coproporus sp.]
MPQMAPLNWTLLFIFFIIIFILFNIMNYYSLNYQPKTYKSKMKNFLINWKW